MYFYDTLPSPLGTITISTDGKYITGLHMQDDRYFKAIPADWKQDTNQPLLQQLRRELEEYFAGKRSHFDVPLQLPGTPFQKAVWNAIQDIPFGKTTSYRTIAEALGKPRAVRAVGSAVGRNPICIVVPCHRVLASDGSLGGFVAGLARKEQLLALEKK